MPSVQEILNADTPTPSFQLNLGKNTPLPDGVTFSRSGSDDVARTFSRENGSFISVPENEPRIYDGSLLLENVTSSNRIKYSNEPNNWTKNGVTLSGSRDPLVSGSNDRGTENNGGFNDHIEKQISGSLVGGPLMYSVFAEKGSANRFKIEALSNSGKMGQATYEFSSGGIIASDTPSSSTILSRSGPDGGQVVKVSIFIPANNAENTQGDNAFFRFFPDDDANGEFTIFHLGQVEDQPTATSPIVTPSLSKERAADNLTFFEDGQPEWWNDDEMTIAATFTNRSFERQFTQIPFNNNQGYLLLFGGGASVPFEAKMSDENTVVDLSNAIPAGKKVKYAVSITAGSKSIAVNGEVSSGNHNGSLLDMTEFSFGVGFGHENILLHDFTAYPQALPPTEGDRRPGGPPSLETLTS